MRLRISTVTRIGLGLCALTLSALFAAHSFGLIPDSERVKAEGRRALCETVAVECCLAAQRNDVGTIRAVTEALVSRNDEILSAGVRRTDGKLLVEAGDHESNWQHRGDGQARYTQVQVPILQGKRHWGMVEIRFRPNSAYPWIDWFMSPATRLILFVALAGFLGQTWYLKRVLQHLDPSTVIPDRVRATLDTLAEGVLVLDKDQRIVLANKAFAKYTGRTADDLQGCKAPEIEWSAGAGASADEAFPWSQTIDAGVAQTGIMIGIDSALQGKRTLVVNTTPILGGKGERRGALATFDDVTSIEEKNMRLEEMLRFLKESRDEIHRQNEELQLLATRDSLTGCLNRRAFFTQFESQWNAAKSRGDSLAILMVDIDHFKSINDNHGHATGDLVLQCVAGVLKSTVGDRGLVCRYGGEEFCALLDSCDLSRGAELAERLRASVAGQKHAGLDITASVGVTDLVSGAREPREFLEQADMAMYFSKRTGRNRITRFIDVPADFSLEKTREGRTSEVLDVDVPIPFHAVTALISALAYRDTLTAEHSRRVADLCVLTARGLMSERECYVLEVAALLHDIGKLGVPDAILLKPGPLTEDEWKIMGTHDRIGVEIIRAAFSSVELTEVVRTHHARYLGQAREPGLPSGEAIPVKARILTIADAYDAMVSDRVYRKGRSRDEAFVELRRCAGKQFDPVLVERFIDAVSASDLCRHGEGLTVPKQTALRIGLQIERLASALDVRDFPNLSAMAGRLAATAAKDGVTQIAELASDLEKSAATDPDLVNVIKLTSELLEMCRSTQTSYLEMSEQKDEE